MGMKKISLCDLLAYSNPPRLSHSRNFSGILLSQFRKNFIEISKYRKFEIILLELLRNSIGIYIWAARKIV